MELRPLRPGEAAVVAELLAGIYAGTGIAFGEADAGEIRRADAAYRRPGGEVWVVDVRETLVGAAAVRPDGGDAREWTLRHLAMAPGWRRMGIGRMLAARARDHAESRGASVLCVRVPPEAAAARSLFASMGFRGAEEGGAEETETLRLPFRPSGSE